MLGVALGVAMTACGPAVDGGVAGESGSGSSGLESSSSSGSSTTAAPPTTASAATTDTGEAESSSSSAGFDSSSDDDNGAGSVGFYGGPGDTGIVDSCDVWEQDCAKDEKCMPWANDGGEEWNALRCTPIDPARDQPGETCTVEGSQVSGIDSCDLGAMCFFVDEATNVGICVPQCEGTAGDPFCEDPSLTCSITHEGVLALCLEP